MNKNFSKQFRSMGKSKAKKVSAEMIDVIQPIVTYGAHGLAAVGVGTLAYTRRKLRKTSEKFGYVNRGKFYPPNGGK